MPDGVSRLRELKRADCFCAFALQERRLINSELRVQRLGLRAGFGISS